MGHRIANVANSWWTSLFGFSLIALLISSSSLGNGSVNAFAPSGGPAKSPAPGGGQGQVTGPVGGAPKFTGPVGGAPKFTGPVGGAPKFTGPVGGAPKFTGPVGGAGQGPGFSAGGGNASFVSGVQIPSDISCKSKEQYDLKTKACEEVGAGEGVFKIIVKGGEQKTNNPGKLQLWVTGNGVTKVRLLSQSSLSDPSGVPFEFQQDVIKVNDPFTVCYKPIMSDKSAPSQSEPVCIGGSNSPDKKPETVTITTK